MTNRKALQLLLAVLNTLVAQLDELVYNKTDGDAYLVLAVAQLGGASKSIREYLVRTE